MPEESRRRPSGWLLIGWALVFALGVTVAVPVVLGLRRDTRAGEVTVPLSLGEVSAPRTRSFRVWTAASLTLFISSVNFDQSRVGSKFRGELHVVIHHPDGTTFFERRFNPDTVDHRMPYNYGDTKLAIVPIAAARIRPWTLSVQVTRADPQFAGVRSELKFWREHADPGMGGMITYVLIFPAIVLLLLAVVLAIVLLQRGRTVPLAISIAAAGAFFFAVWFR
jgi:hypothetical protein